MFGASSISGSREARNPWKLINFWLSVKFADALQSNDCRDNYLELIITKKLDGNIADVTGSLTEEWMKWPTQVEDSALLAMVLCYCSTRDCYPKINFTLLIRTMKPLLKRFALLLALPISVLANFSLTASADSTAGIILHTKCQDGYNINIWQNHTSGELLYRATHPNSHLSLG